MPLLGGPVRILAIPQRSTLLRNASQEARGPCRDYSQAVRPAVAFTAPVGCFGADRVELQDVEKAERTAGEIDAGGWHIKP